MGFPSTCSFPAGQETATTYTNAQKLSLPANTAVGTKVKVSDGFVVSGVGNPDVDGFYYPSGTTINGKPVYQLVGFDNTHTLNWETGGVGWYFQWDAVHGVDDVAFPWLVTTWNDGTIPTLTHPAVQQLAAPSSAQGGVFVSGGTLDGIYTTMLNDQAGKHRYQLLGVNSDDNISNIAWVDDSPFLGWKIFSDVGDALYYSLSNVATPDLASNWKNASDDSPASITVTNVSQGELDDGVTVAGAGTSSVNGIIQSLPTGSNGFPAYGDIDGTASHVTNGADGHWYATSNVNYIATSNAGFPFGLTFTPDDGTPPAPTVTRNNIASEANWSTTVTPFFPSTASY